MTKDEILQNVNIIDIARSYGVRVNSQNMCSCPFHGKDRHPSMKFKNNHYTCYACGRNGDVFDFVMELTKCSFYDAFTALGGSYEKTGAEDIKKYKKKAEFRKINTERENYIISKTTQKVCDILYFCDQIDSLDSNIEPFSDLFCYLCNIKPIMEDSFDRLMNKNREIRLKEAVSISEKAILIGRELTRLMNVAKNLTLQRLKP